MTLQYKLREILWKIFGRPDCPPKVKKFNPLRIREFDGAPYLPRANVMYYAYTKGMSIENMSVAYNITRERVRQCLWKAYHDHHKMIEFSNCRK